MDQLLKTENLSPDMVEKLGSLNEIQQKRFVIFSQEVSAILAYREITKQAPNSACAQAAFFEYVLRKAKSDSGSWEGDVSKDGNLIVHSSGQSYLIVLNKASFLEIAATLMELDPSSDFSWIYPSLDRLESECEIDLRLGRNMIDFFDERLNPAIEDLSPEKRRILYDKIIHMDDFVVTDNSSLAM
jgi:hypothetical protein